MQLALMPESKGARLIYFKTAMAADYRRELRLFLAFTILKFSQL